MHWTKDPNGSPYRMRQFDTPSQSSMRMRSLALDELSAPKKQRSHRSLRLMLPSWLTRRTVRDAEEMAENMEQSK